MATKKKLLQAAAGSAGGGAGALNVEDVFSTYLYEGNGDKQFIDNGINLGQANDGYSGYFGGSGYYVGAEQTQLTDFTVEGWFYFSNLGSNRSLFTLGYNDLQAYYRSASSNFAIYDGSSKTYSWTPSGSTWYHIAVVRSGSSVELFVDGVSKGTQTSSATISGDLIIGGYAGATDPMNGYISNIRVSDNVRYSSNFTAPTSALTTDANTTLLTLQDDTFIDNSGDGNVITPNGGAKMVSHAPFTAADAGEGGLVWIKQRGPETTSFHSLFDTERGDGARLVTNSSNAQNVNQAYYNTSFNSNGFTIGSGNDTGTNKTGSDYASWTFRKAPKFFDVVTYTGDGIRGKTINHNLGSTPGLIIIKRTSGSEAWAIYHRSLGATKHLRFSSDSQFDDLTVFADTEPTDTVFSVGEDTKVNGSSSTYVAYLFAHNDGDGDFGPTGDQDIIKCGSYSGTSPEINLGWEPQWILIKNASTTNDYSDWMLVDNMRGLTADGTNSKYFRINESTAEGDTSTSAIAPIPTSTGFRLTNAGSTSWGGASTDTYIYIAIRRGPMAVPTDATDVFDVEYSSQNSDGYYANLGAVTDTWLYKDKSTSSNWLMRSRLTGANYLNTNLTNAETSQSVSFWDNMNGVGPTGSTASTNTNRYSWVWKRAPNYFDVVAYTGNGTAGRTVSHNLGVAPEMMWVKSRTGSTGRWAVYHKDLGNTDYLFLNEADAAGTFNAWNDTTPTDSVFSLSSWSTVNDASRTYIAYLFASLDGVSKVGSYTGTGAAQNIDCGFSSGARFVLIKCSSHTGNWRILDTTRGIVAGNDAQLYLDLTDAEYSGEDVVDPYSSGFSVTTGTGNVNVSGRTYIFYAIA